MRFQACRVRRVIFAVGQYSEIGQAIVMPGFKPSTFKPAPPPIHHREQLTVALADGREVTLLRVRDPRARRMRLSVSERGVRLTLPRAVSLRAANAFVADRKSVV